MGTKRARDDTAGPDGSRVVRLMHTDSTSLERIPLTFQVLRKAFMSDSVSASRELLTRLRGVLTPLLAVGSPLVAGLLLLAAGCASYVNIPAEHGRDPAVNRIDVAPAPFVIAAALDYVVHDNPPPATPYAVVLPAESTDPAWRTILRRHPEAVRGDWGRGDEPVYEVLTVRIRGRDAWVDILVPEARDNRRLVEVRLKGWFDGWKVTSVRRWSPRVMEERQRVAPTPEDWLPRDQADDDPGKSQVDSLDRPIRPSPRAPLRPVVPAPPDR
jgi:hypothetical protein